MQDDDRLGIPTMVRCVEYLFESDHQLSVNDDLRPCLKLDRFYYCIYKTS